jgi:hypothetical protein
MVIPCVLAVIAMVFTWTSAFHCSFFVITEGINDMTAGYGLQHTISSTIKVGLWLVQEEWEYEKPDSEWTTENTGYWVTSNSSPYEASKSCVNWDESSLDKLPGPAVKFARMFSVLAGLLGAILVILLICYAAWDPFCGLTKDMVVSALPARDNFPTVSWVPILSGGCLVAGMLTLLFLTVLASPVCTDERVDTCQLSGAGYLCVIAVVLWWLAAAAIWYLGRSQAEPEQAAVLRKPKQQPISVDRLSMDESVRSSTNDTEDEDQPEKHDV